MKVCNCSYCELHKGWPILWQIKKNFFWYEVPKNCSSSIKSKYKSIKKIENIDTNNINNKIVVIWRDPVERFYSLFLHYFDQKGARFISADKFFTKRNYTLSKIDIEDKLNLMFEYINEFDSEMEVHHFYPQSHFINFDYNNMIEYVNIKDASKTLKIPKTNTTKRPSYNFNFSEEQLQKIYKMYKSDYNFITKNNLQCGK